jgi:hypothetical protein
LLLPEVGFTVSQASLELTVQGTLEVRVMAKLPAAALGASVVGDTVSIGATCVTVTVRVIPPPVKVNIPLRELASVFAI